MTRAPRQRFQRGSATGEFIVLLLAFLLIFLFMIVEPSHTWLDTVSTAAREGMVPVT